MLWSTLKEYGTGRWVRWSYFWLFFVPVAAKFLSDVQDNISIDLGDQHLELNMDLPFSWVLFYFGAVAFALAYFIYFHACPALIRDYNDYSDYKAAGKGESYIRDVFYNYALAWSERTPNERLGSVITTVRYYRARFVAPGDNADELERQLKTGNYKQPQTPEEWDEWKKYLPKNMGFAAFTPGLGNTDEVFWFVRSELLDSSKPAARNICSVLNVIGFLAHLWVLGQGFQYVWYFASKSIGLG